MLMTPLSCLQLCWRSVDRVVVVAVGRCLRSVTCVCAHTYMAHVFCHCFSQTHTHHLQHPHLNATLDGVVRLFEINLKRRMTPSGVALRCVVLMGAVEGLTS